MSINTFNIARAYQHAFNNHPNRTLAITGGTLNALGDIVAQISQNISIKDHESRQYWDSVRTLRFFCFGCGLINLEPICLRGPLFGRWNLFLERRFPLRAWKSQHRVSFRALSKRVAADQLIMAPIGLVIFVGSMGIMERRSTSQIREKYADMYAPALLTNWKVWPVAQMINFRYMPLPYRVPFQSACGVFWTLYLSILNANEDERQDKESLQRIVR